MKNEIYKLMLCISMFLLSCNHDTRNTAQRNEDNYKLIKSQEQCFTAIYKKDSAFLKFKIMPNGKIQGKLIIKYSEPGPNDLEREFYHGDIIGQFKKDTLFADFIFADGGKKTVYKNPIALLKKNNKLILGFGAIENYLGKSWLMNHKEINFNRSRFQFLPTECNN
ncbi:MAG: hypothetical protein ABJA76_04755 [Mucilaginibacter sp.]